MAAKPPSPLSLKARALQWLSQREHSRSELRRKLLSVLRAQARDAAARAAASTQGDPAPAPDAARGPGDDARADPAAEVEALLDWLVAQRYLSEQRFVESRVHARSARFGNLRIRQELAQHGASLDAATAQALKHSELERARAVWARKFGQAPADAAARARQMRFLAGRGFSSDTIRQVLSGDED